MTYLKYIKILSFFTLLYFLILVGISIINIKTPSLFNIIGEIITIPLLLFTAFGFIFSSIKLIKGERGVLLTSILILNLCTIVLLTVTTLSQM